jgi:hypothetical protein
MITVDVPALDLAPIDLSHRSVRGLGVAAPVGTVSLGGPFWTLLPDGDSEHSAFGTDPAWRWLLGVLAVSFEPPAEAGDRYDRAWVEITLSRTDANEPLAVAWSMKPDRIAHDVSRTTRVSIGSDFKIADIGLDASLERETTTPLEQVSLEASREMTATPRWLFHRTPSAELRGCTRLALTVRAPVDSRVEAKVDFGCAVSHRRWVFFWKSDETVNSSATTILP